MGDRDVGDVVAGGDDVGRQAFALGADDERHLAVDGSSRSGAPSRATSAIRRPGSSATSRTRATGTENSAPIEARTALWPYGSALPGPSATQRRAERQRGADDRADVARVADAPQRDAARPDGRRPALRVDADRARAGAELGDRRRARAARPGCPSRPLPVAA